MMTNSEDLRHLQTLNVAQLRQALAYLHGVLDVIDRLPSWHQAVGLEPWPLDPPESFADDHGDDERDGSDAVAHMTQDDSDLDAYSGDAFGRG